ncbi:MAG: hypothetical protein RLY31_333 [Bacteroidota bacterium]|jgi:23S rRNA (cytidine1920-2'-O)/16S rRNA (cytidine1409-2'-O)-methyltransferase
MRIDAWLVQQGYFDSRQRAQRAISAGKVLCDGRPVCKPSLTVQQGQTVVVEGDPLAYVSRGGLKLEQAIRHFDLTFQDRTILDVGASTGGFTDCALQHGASRVYAVDVGSGQLAAGLRRDPRVVCLEQTDIRTLSLAAIGGQPVDVIVSDLSFISLTMVIPAFPSLLRRGGTAVWLVKPQFEMERRTAFKGGIVKDPALREKALEKVLHCARTHGFLPAGHTETVVGEAERRNVEFLAYLSYP